MSIGSVAEFFLAKPERTDQIQKTETQPVVIPLHAAPNEIRERRNKFAEKFKKSS